jgi:hypothetical protein
MTPGRRTSAAASARRTRPPAARRRAPAPLGARGCAPAWCAAPPAPWRGRARPARPGVRAGRGEPERRLRSAGLAHLDDLARLEPEARPVHLLAVDREVAVHDQLAGLVDGAGQAGPVHHGVEAALQQRDHGLAGLARGAVRVLVRPAHLRLADVAQQPRRGRHRRGGLRPQDKHVRIMPGRLLSLRGLI